MSSIRLAYLVALAEKRGVNLDEVHGSVTEYPFCNTFGQTDAQPLDLNLKLWLDSSEYIVRNKIHMRSGILSQHFQESGSAACWLMSGALILMISLSYPMNL
jgi:hypothetical protein